MIAKLYFGDIWGRRAISIRGKIDQKMVDKVSRRLDFFNRKGNEKITVVLASNGGCLSSALLISKLMKQSNSPIEVVLLSCSGCATVILATGTPGHRRAFNSSQIFPALKKAEFYGDQNLQPFMDKYGFSLDVIMNPFLLSCLVEQFLNGDSEKQELWAKMLPQIAAKDDTNRTERRFVQNMPEQFRRAMLGLTIYGAILGSITGLEEKVIHKLMTGLDTEDLFVDRYRSEPVRLFAEEALNIGLLDSISPNGFDTKKH